MTCISISAVAFFIKRDDFVKSVNLYKFSDLILQEKFIKEHLYLRRLHETESFIKDHEVAAKYQKIAAVDAKKSEISSPKKTIEFAPIGTKLISRQ